MQHSNRRGRRAYAKNLPNLIDGGRKPEILSGLEPVLAFEDKRHKAADFFLIRRSKGVIFPLPGNL
jgi:hypothetical protein